MTGAVRAIFRLLRAEQWVKNAFVFGGVLFTGRLRDPASLLGACATFAAFSAVASAGYIDNDVADREADRLHPVKRRRPLAARAVGVGTARLVQVLLLAGGVALGWRVDPRVGALVAGYSVLGVLYSRWLKHVVVLDVIVIAVGFVLRVIAGCAAIDVAPSRWIALCTFMLALFLGLGKRRHEVLLLGDRIATHRPALAQYGLPLLDQLIAMVGALTAMCYIMFTMWPETIARHGTTDLVYTVPIVMYGLFRYAFLVYRADGGGDPTATLLLDRQLMVVAVVWGVSAALLVGAQHTGEPWIAG